MAGMMRLFVQELNTADLLNKFQINHTPPQVPQPRSPHAMS